MEKNSLSPSAMRSEFLTLFRGIALERHRHDVFRDFVTTSAIAIHNAVNMNEELETEYLNIINTYNSEDIQRMCEMLGLLTMLLEPEPTDILGGLYMEIGLGSEQNGQYFTPAAVSELMAQIGHGDGLRNLDKPFVTLSEPACGAGGMVLAFAKIMLSHKHNPADKLWVSCIDINRVAALMAYLQLSLWNIPGEIIVGNALSMEMRERWLTPAHYLNNWEYRLRMQALLTASKSTTCDHLSPTEEGIQKTPPQQLGSGCHKINISTGEQVAFDFEL
ncbi:N-6 DNA methylase [Thalassotalea agarivorans]|uniref:N-6 DNA Methylase n=1 Tax=Thalassotalea agarivorans TaxID=349064 RepID=A0A1I0GJB8_THASX|nr:N-6 DNA methylase [Thalassotalea agarivorans]SET71114.1 N-6 DNA Methylase [Thalassotalea agarivorans]